MWSRSGLRSASSTHNTSFPPSLTTTRNQVGAKRCIAPVLKPPFFPLHLLLLLLCLSFHTARQNFLTQSVGRVPAESPLFIISIYLAAVVQKKTATKTPKLRKLSTKLTDQPRATSLKGIDDPRKEPNNLSDESFGFSPSFPRLS